MIKTAQRDDLGSNRLEQAFTQAWHWHYRDCQVQDTWSPSINIYRLPDRLEICVDLSGVQRESIDLRVEPGHLTLRGIRSTPEPQRGTGELMRIVNMEIDHGPFCRAVALPENIDSAQVESRYDNGLLWVHLPLRDTL